MENAFFRERDLLSYSKYRLVSSVTSDINPVKPDAKYLNWINQNKHKNYNREIMFVLSGESYFTLNGITYLARPGTIFLIDKNDEHDFYYPPFCKNVRHLWFTIANQTIFFGLHSTKKDIKGKNFNCPVSRYNHTGLAFLNAWDEFSANRHFDAEFIRLRVKNAFICLFTEICKIGYDKIINPDEYKTIQHHSSIIKPLLEHIKETGGKNLDVAELAHIAGYSTFYFASVFKNITGMSVLKFINQCRIEKYKELTAKGFNKKQISNELGFSCPAAFSRWLRNIRQLTVRTGRV